MIISLPDALDLAELTAALRCNGSKAAKYKLRFEEISETAVRSTDKMRHNCRKWPNRYLNRPRDIT